MNQSVNLFQLVLLPPNQQFFSNVGTFSGLNHYWEEDKMFCSRPQYSTSSGVRISDPSISSQAPYHLANELLNDEFVIGICFGVNKPCEFMWNTCCKTIHTWNRDLVWRVSSDIVWKPQNVQDLTGQDGHFVQRNFPVIIIYTEPKL